MTKFPRTTTNQVEEALDMIAYATQMGHEGDLKDGHGAFALLSDDAAVPTVVWRDTNKGVEIVRQIRLAIDMARYGVSAGTMTEDAGWDAVVTAFHRYTTASHIGIVEGLAGSAYLIFPYGDLNS